MRPTLRFVLLSLMFTCVVMVGPLESGLELALDPPMITPSLVAPSSPSTLRDNTMLTITLPNPPFTLA